MKYFKQLVSMVALLLSVVSYAYGQACSINSPCHHPSKVQLGVWGGITGGGGAPTNLDIAHGVRIIDKSGSPAETIANCNNGPDHNGQHGTNGNGNSSIMYILPEDKELLAIALTAASTDNSTVNIRYVIDGVEKDIWGGEQDVTCRLIGIEVD